MPHRPRRAVWHRHPRRFSTSTTPEPRHRLIRTCPLVVEVVVPTRVGSSGEAVGRLERAADIGGRVDPSLQGLVEDLVDDLLVRRADLAEPTMVRATDRGVRVVDTVGAIPLVVQTVAIDVAEPDVIGVRAQVVDRLDLEADRWAVRSHSRRDFLEVDVEEEILDVDREELL